MAQIQTIRKYTENLLQQVKKAVQALEPDAEIVLYGSRAREEAQPDSDWDFLILLTENVTETRQRKIRSRIYEIELETGEVLCSLIQDKQEWATPLFKAMPFYQNIQKDGIWL